jgi:hypothetical protein
MACIGSVLWMSGRAHGKLDCIFLGPNGGVLVDDRRCRADDIKRVFNTPADVSAIETLCVDGSPHRVSSQY